MLNKSASISRSTKQAAESGIVGGEMHLAGAKAHFSFSHLRHD
jgi:hypothetical protein